MKLNKLFIVFIICFGLPVYGQNNGATPCTAIDLYQAAIGDCNNSCGAQLCGEYQCENAGCTNVAMPGTATVDGSCTPDNDVGQACVWLSVTATAADIVIQNETNYAGAGGAEAEDRDYTIFSGPCSSLTEVGCAADVDDGSSATFTGLTVGDTYFIQVTQSQGAIATCAGCTGASSCAQSSVPFDPVNDDCANATSMTSGTPVNSTNANSTVGTDLAVCLNPASGSVENTVWFEWCAPVTWTPLDSAYVHIYNQTCNGTQGMQMSVYGASETCATIAAGTATSDVCENPGSTSDFFYSFEANPLECFLIVLDGFAGTACDFDIQVNDSPILVSELKSFIVKEKSTGRLIEWTLFSESNNDQYEIEFSIDGLHFESVGTVQSLGDFSTEHTYQLIDTRNQVMDGYYKLIEKDLNGKSKTLDVTYFESSALKAFNVYPNPAKEFIQVSMTIKNKKYQDVEFEIFSNTGLKIVSTRLELDHGKNVFQIDISDLNPGLYIIKATSDSQIQNYNLVVY